MKRLTILSLAAALTTGALMPAVSYAADAKIEGPEVMEIADVTVGLNGLVCDFCSLALNKTFQKRAEVRGSYVDLDAKTLSVALAEGQTLDDDTIVQLVKKAGYTATVITRKDGRETIIDDKS